MPDVAKEVVAKFWQEAHDFALYRIIASMELVETWTLDEDEEFEKGILELSQLIDDFPDFDISHEDHWIKVLGYLKSSRALRFMQYMDANLKQGAAAKLLMYAESNTQKEGDYLNFFLKRNLVFERLQLLGRIFAPERFNLVVRAMEREY